MANAIAERWVGTLRRELIDRTIIWNRHQLDRLVIDYIDYYNHHRPHRSVHYNHHRPHRSLRQQPPAPPTKTRRRPRSSRGSRAAERSSTSTGQQHEQARHHFPAPTGLAAPAVIANATGP